MSRLPGFMHTIRFRLTVLYSGLLFVLASLVPESERQWALLVRQEVRARLGYLLQPGTVLCLPTTPFPAPLKGLASSVQNPLRDRITCLCCHGGHGGVPQVSIPGARVDGAPIGLSVVGPHGSDAMLVNLALAMEAAS